MELKSLPTVVISVLSHWIGSRDLLSLICTEKSWDDLLESHSLWVMKAKQCGIYQPEFEQLDAKKIRMRIVSHMRCVYREIRVICSKPEYAKRLCKIVIDDDAVELENSVLATATHSARALLPIAMRFGRFAIIHSLFTHFQVPQHHTWLLFAIRHELYGVIKYLLEVQKLPLLCDQPYMLLPVLSHVWDPKFTIADNLGRRHHGYFRPYNELLVNEILRCRHPKIVNYLMSRLNHGENPAGEMLDRMLFAKLKRHSLLGVPLVEYCPSPNLQHLG